MPDVKMVCTKTRLHNMLTALNMVLRIWKAYIDLVLLLKCNILNFALDGLREIVQHLTCLHWGIHPYKAN